MDAGEAVPSDPTARLARVHALLKKARKWWLTKHDVLDVLTNWQAYQFRISSTAPDQPGRSLLGSLGFAGPRRVSSPRPHARCLAAGSLFLFDRTQLRSFRRDNHDWRKKADGKTVKETHEKIKVRRRACRAVRPPRPRTRRLWAPLCASAL